MAQMAKSMPRKLEVLHFNPSATKKKKRKKKKKKRCNLKQF
jgi:hypothetical protein